MIREWLDAGQAGQRGIISTAPPLGRPTTFALVDNNRIHAVAWNGLVISDGSDFHQLILMYTYMGDTNLDGRVTESDLVNVIANLGHSGSWLDGDVTGDGWINEADFAAVTAALGAGTGGDLFGRALPGLSARTSAIPEPSGIVICGLLALALLSRPPRPGCKRKIINRNILWISSANDRKELPVLNVHGIDAA